MEEDSSTVRIKVAQYFVNKRLQELDEELRIKIDNWTPQALPAPAKFPRDPEHDHLVEPGAGLPPPFPTPGRGDPEGKVSWKDLLDVFAKDRETRGAPGLIPEGIVYPPHWGRVAIIGAGVAGLHTAKLLQDLGVPYTIFEASDRPGGRVFTYEFLSKPPTNPQGKHDYYDLGPMRFPMNQANQITFDLIESLGLSDKLIDFIMSIDDNIYNYNGER
jgi:hypothetical protein